MCLLITPNSGLGLMTALFKVEEIRQCLPFGCVVLRVSEVNLERESSVV